MKRILIVDDELGSRESLRAVFRKQYEVQTAENAVEAMSLISRVHFDLVILDVIMPRVSGLVLLNEIREIFPEIPAVIISASCTDAVVEEARTLKAIAVICKPFDVPELRSLVDQTLQASIATRQQLNLTRELARNHPCSIFGESPAMKKAIEEAQSASRSDAPVLLLGEPGTGRDLFARQIHAWSSRGSEPFIKIECSCYDDATFEGEFFGQSIPGTENQIKAGALDMAGAGSIFLDRAQMLPTMTQGKIVEVIRIGQFQRCGFFSKMVPHAVRFFASCDLAAPAERNCQLLRDEIRESFSGPAIYVPPLRERRTDIPVIASQLLGRLNVTQGSRMTTIEAEALARLQSYSWPGNVRELHNVLERIVVLFGNEEVLKVTHLPQEISGVAGPTSRSSIITFNAATDQLHRQLIVDALTRSNGVLRKAAQLLDVTPRVLQLRMRKLNIEADSVRQESVH